jgi:CheY-like chemotaxis protein
MRLPDRSGDDLAREMRTLRPDLPVVIASGYDKPHLEKLFAQDRRIVVVAKPYLSNDLRDALRRVGVLPARDAGAT